MNQFGISLYLSTGYEKNKEIIAKAREAKISYAFTSLHIPEESVNNYVQEAEKLLALCKSSSIFLIVDIGPRTLEKLGYASFADLKQTSISHLRVDYGFTYQQIMDLSKNFNIVFNASTLREQDLRELQRLNADFTRFSACHNFYPKPLTGLSLEKTRSMNDNLRRLGMTTMAFAAGDKELRGPLHMGLPTVETSRSTGVLLSMLQLMKDCHTDICLVGDIDISDEAWRGVKELSEGYVSLKAEIDPEYRFIMDEIHHDRPDSSEYVIRSQESRAYASQGKLFPAQSVKPRGRGSISVGNEGYLRYSGELEIARRDLEPEPKVNIVGQVDEGSMQYLDYITDGMGFRLIQK